MNEHEDLQNAITEKLLPLGGVAPNQYHLSGGGLQVTYFPDGAGPIPAGHGPTCLAYQDASRFLRFDKAELEITSVPALGEIISATIANTPDFGSTTFSLLIPIVKVPNELSNVVPIQTVAITTLHRTFLAGIGQGQLESYTTVALSGSASNGPVPL